MRDLRICHCVPHERNIELNILPFILQLWTVELCLTQPMVKLDTLLELHTDRQPATVVIVQTTTWWEIGHGHVKLMEGGLGVHLHVKVCCRAVQGI